MGKRVDTIVVLAGVVFVIEFKTGDDDNYRASAIDQTVDYALDLKNFHAGSHARRLVPVLIAMGAENVPRHLVWSSDGVATPLQTNGDDLGVLLRSVVQQTRSNKHLIRLPGHQAVTNQHRRSSKPLKHSIAGIVSRTFKERCRTRESKQNHCMSCPNYRGFQDQTPQVHMFRHRREDRRRLVGDD